ncbi:hypothetical protein [Levilactobacillus brevis]|uniref:hypothetical protein n=1 Tax=Levilactobacillus brevis TaxID=1580 RepID=UPI0011199228|nr:hypothetical protein [Levilactobacillus brevis]QCZ50922.1 Prophage P1 protein 59 [Levilactobacillus brevis]QCZ50975.1 Prophage P1 protein 59 [Levilactobacillus brevis]
MRPPITWEDWASIMAILTALFGGIGWLLNRYVKGPIGELRKELQKFRESETGERERLEAKVTRIGQRLQKLEDYWGFSQKK